MKCPKCNKQQYCNCSHCAETYSKGQVVQKRLGNDIIACGHCNHTLHIDGWGEEEAKQNRESEEVK